MRIISYKMGISPWNRVYTPFVTVNNFLLFPFYGCWYKWVSINYFNQKQLFSFLTFCSLPTNAWESFNTGLVLFHDQDNIPLKQYTQFLLFLVNYFRLKWTLLNISIQSNSLLARIVILFLPIHGTPLIHDW